MFIKILLATLVLSFYFNCNPHQNNNLTGNRLQEAKTEISQSQETTKEIPNDLLITLERGRCYGNCPAYKLSAKSNGSVLFEGLANTKVKGRAKAKISKEKITQLIDEFKNTAYFCLEDKYNFSNCVGVTDQPRVLTSIKMNGRKQSINHYLGCYGKDADSKNILSKLKKLENKIDEIVETKRWIGERK